MFLLFVEYVETANERTTNGILMAKMSGPEVRQGRPGRRRDFPKLYSLRASEEVCPKHRNVHREMPVATAIMTCDGVRSLL